MHVKLTWHTEACDISRTTFGCTGSYFRRQLIWNTKKSSRMLTIMCKELVNLLLGHRRLWKDAQHVGNVLVTTPTAAKIRVCTRYLVHYPPMAQARLHCLIRQCDSSMLEPSLVCARVTQSGPTMVTYSNAGWKCRTNQFLQINTEKIDEGT